METQYFSSAGACLNWGFRGRRRWFFLSWRLWLTDGWVSPLPSELGQTDLGRGQSTTTLINRFQQVSLTELRDIVLHMKPTSSPHNVITFRIIMDSFDTVGPSFQTIINSCLASGTVPSCFKHAVVQPLLKKPNLDTKCLKDYHPISKLPYISSDGKGCLVTTATIFRLKWIIGTFLVRFQSSS